MLILLLATSGFSQESNPENKDSIFLSKPYPYVLPILGQKVHERKVRTPLPFGIMFNSLVGKQQMAISGLNVALGI